ncbi:ExbD/TolR family protein [Solitalea koreensis]|uniref:Biopolymer transport protein ExbD/TolR n=1 Tax=Solitalea koreensis TaxID=543615 RepID=A0A521C5U5_9SPHI|nr:biopolymer transporter ExbD [Solitalea koreensis]SMO54887.1 Biopolymer transport protein ExbD/TolR [Solitalea koreensis]
MADIDSSGGGSSPKKGKKKRGKKLSTRVDMTPMVDLGFLLITFFMLTTSMSKPQAMEINVPDNTKIPENQETKIKASQAMTILLTGKDQIVYYFGVGEEVQEPQITDYSAGGIRKILLDEARKRNPSFDSIAVYENQFKSGKISEELYKANRLRIQGYKNGLIILIKADDKARYKNFVDILDEMLITNNGRYAIVDIAPSDLKMIETNPYLKK